MSKDYLGLSAKTTDEILHAVTHLVLIDIIGRALEMADTIDKALGSDKPEPTRFDPSARGDASKMGQAECMIESAGLVAACEWLKKRRATPK